MRIAVVTGSLSRRSGGFFESVRALSKALARAHEVRVFGLRDHETEADMPAWAPLKPQALKTRGPTTLGYAPQLFSALTRAAPDVVHLHGVWAFTSHAVAAWRRRTGRPVVVSPRGMLDPWALRNSAWKKRLAAALYERENLTNAAFVALAQSEAEAIRAYGLEGSVKVIPNGVTLPPSQAPAQPAFLGEDPRRVLLFLGRLHPKKGLAELVEAWATLPADGAVRQGWRLVIAGWDDGGHLDGLQRMAERHALDIAFPGPAFGAEKAALLNAADAFILPSHSEGLPMGVLEAWAHDLPVFMTQACNLPEGFAHGAALEIPTAPDALAAALAQGLTRADLDAIGHRGRDLVTTHFTWQTIAGAHSEFYESLIERRRAEL